MNFFCEATPLRKWGSSIAYITCLLFSMAPTDQAGIRYVSLTGTGLHHLSRPCSTGCGNAIKLVYLLNSNVCLFVKLNCLFVCLFVYFFVLFLFSILLLILLSIFILFCLFVCLFVCFRCLFVWNDGLKFHTNEPRCHSDQVDPLVICWNKKNYKIIQMDG